MLIVGASKASDKISCKLPVRLRLSIGPVSIMGVAAFFMAWTIVSITLREGFVRVGIKASCLASVVLVAKLVKLSKGRAKCTGPGLSDFAIRIQLAISLLIVSTPLDRQEYFVTGDDALT